MSVPRFASNPPPAPSQTRGPVIERRPLVVVVDDDSEIRSLLGRYLQEAGFAVETAGDGEALDRLLHRLQPDLIVLDLMLPGEDGLTICRRLRTHGDVPILMLTARGDPVDRVIGFELGADDYVVKPFIPRELLSRIKAILKRSRPAGTAARSSSLRDQPLRRTFHFCGWTLDEAARALLAPDAKQVLLTGGEFRLIHALVRAAGRVLSRDDLAREMQGRDSEAYDRSIDVAVSRMRRKLGDDPRSPRMIRTVHASGYLFIAEVERRDG